MNFSDRVLTATMGRPPQGWQERLSLRGYAALEDERKRYYEPLFAKYRTKKIRDYDPDYGNFAGWKPIRVGIGEPIGYEYGGYIPAKVIDAVLTSNVLMHRVLGKKEDKA